MVADTPKRTRAVPPAPDPDEEPPSQERPTLPAIDLESLAPAAPEQESGPRPLRHRALIAELGDRFANGDYEGALALAESVDPEDDAHPVAAFCAKRCREALEAVFVDRVGGVGHAPRLLLSGEALRSARLDHRAGFIVALVDGRTRVEEIVDASAMTRFDALRILDDLVARGIVE